MSETCRFKTFCLENYKAAHNLTGKETVKLFAEFGVFDYLERYYDILHGMSTQYMIDDIGEYIRVRQQPEHA